jgi:hypothetical protein
LRSYSEPTFAIESVKAHRKVFEFGEGEVTRVRSNRSYDGVMLRGLTQRGRSNVVLETGGAIEEEVTTEK